MSSPPPVHICVFLPLDSHLYANAAIAKINDKYMLSEQDTSVWRRLLLFTNVFDF